MNSVGMLCEQGAEKFGDKTCLIYAGQKVSYKELDQNVSRTGAAFREAGLVKGDRVAIMLSNRPEYFYLWFGLNKIGASMVPVNTEFTAYEAEYLINHSEAKILAIDESRRHILEKLKDTCPNLQKVLILDGPAQGDGEVAFEDFIKPFSDDLRSIPLDVNDEAAVLYTSGTTGRPKGCVVDHFYYLNIGEKYVNNFGIDSSDVIMTPLPLFHMNAQSMTGVGGVSCGASIVLIDRFHPVEWWKTIREQKVTIFHYLGVIPAILHGLPPSESDPLPQKTIGVGAGVPKDIHAAFEKRFNVELLELYGSTEGGGGGSFMTGRDPADRRVGTSCFGRPMPDVEARIADHLDQDVPHGEVGELLTRNADPSNPAKGCMKGYLKDEKATREVWRGGWFHTGDFCYRDEDGRFYFVDRKKDIIRRSGENISASEVETVVRQHPAVMDAAAIAVPDEKRIEEIKVYVVKALNAEVEFKEIIEWCEERLAYFKIPRYLEFRDSLPKTSTEKIKKNELKNEKSDLTEGAWDRTKNMKLKRDLEREKKRQAANK